jgi:uncharacterized protein (TIGR03435 family)
MPLGQNPEVGKFTLFSIDIQRGSRLLLACTERAEAGLYDNPYKRLKEVVLSISILGNRSLRVRVGSLLALGLLSPLICTAQTPAAKFEVAVIKPVSPDSRAPAARGLGRPTNPLAVSYSRISLRILLTTAFGIRPFQLSAPQWAENSRYDIQARMPEGESKDHLGLMLQDLLAERFLMKYHKEPTEVSGYELVLENSGKLHSAKPVLADPNNVTAPKATFQGLDKDGRPRVSEGWTGQVPIAYGNGLLHIAGRGQNITEIVRMCESRTGRPVIDKTGLDGRYDFDLDFQMGGILPEEPSTDAAPSGLDPGVPFEVALRGIGLRLRRTKVVIDVIVIDSLQKSPTEN